MRETTALNRTHKRKTFIRIKKLLLGPLLRVNCAGGEDSRGEISLQEMGRWRLLCK